MVLGTTFDSDADNYQSHDSDIVLDHSGSSSETDGSDDAHGFVLRVRSSSKAGLHLPPAEIIQQLWDTFVENFDPLTKIVHVPTLRPAFEKAIGNVQTISRNFQTLMFAIFGAAVLTLRDDECQRRFQETRRSMLLKYTSATEVAFARAKFMSTTSLVVLQALVIHLFSVRDIYDTRTVWTLTGVAVRIAQGIGLDRDGTVLGLSPFDTEVRRRVWWQLKSHDFRAAELCGLAKFRDLATGHENTKWPTNINDDELSPGMSSSEGVASGLTDASFIAFKFEMTSFAASRVAAFRKLGKEPSHWNLDTQDNDKVETQSAVEKLGATLEMKYLRYCDPSQPLHLVLLLVGRYGMNIVTFLTHHPRRWATMKHVSQSERGLVWDVSIKLLEQYNMMLSNPLLHRFSWHAPYFQQWHAFIHVLDTLRAEPLKSDASKLWQLVSSIYDNTPDMLLDLKKPIHVAIGNLCLKAYSAREAAVLNSNTHFPPIPNFISQLRQLREAAMAKRQARKANTEWRTKSLAHEAPLGQVPDIGYSGVGLETPNYQESGTQHLSNLTQAASTTKEDAQYIFDVFDNNNEGSMYMDLDFTLPEEYSMENYVPGPINWEQWDTWLADSNLMRSSSS
jgi:hypothetical protein